MTNPPRSLENTSFWPFLDDTNHVITSERDRNYNCAGWAVEQTQSGLWWPLEGHYWPVERKDDSLEAFIEGYGVLGFEICGDDSLEPGFDKIAIYASPSRAPLHVARQLPDGRWTSKMGLMEDIEHERLHDLVGGTYGYPAVYMRRMRVQRRRRAR